MNAFTYIKNVGKSAKYIAIDIAKDYSPGLSSLAEQASELGPELYKSIKEFKANPGDKVEELGYINDTKDVFKEFGKNLLEDVKTGNFYNKQRIQAGEEEDFNNMMKSMGIDLDFDSDFADDDFGDFEFEDDDKAATAKAEMGVEQQTTAATIKALDITGSKISGAIGSATVNSADYIVKSNRANNKAIYSLTNRGFERTTAGLAAINSNITNLVNLAQPLTTHMQNSQQFFTNSTNNQEKMINLLTQISENTAPKVINTNSFKRKSNTVDDFITDGVLDIRNTLDFIKGGINDFRQSVKSLLGFDLMGGYKGSLNAIVNPKAPMVTLIKLALSKALPDAFKEALEDFQGALGGFTGMALDKLGKVDFSSKFGTGGIILDLLFNRFKPESGYKDKIDTSKYEKGKVDWDGISRKALTDVIPKQLASIISILSGQPPKLFDYQSGSWKSMKEVQTSFNESKRYAARFNSGSMMNDYDKTISQMKRNKSIDDKQAERLTQSGNLINSAMFHSDNSDYMDMLKWNSSEIKDHAKEIGVSPDELKAYIAVLKHGGPAKRLKYGGDIARGRASYGRTMSSLEAEGGIETSLFDNSFSNYRSKGSLKLGELKEDEKIRSIFGVDEYDHDMFFYLRNIYVSTSHMAENLPYLAGKSNTILATAASKTVKDAEYKQQTSTEKPTSSALSPASNFKFNDADINNATNGDIFGKSDDEKFEEYLGKADKSLYDYYKKSKLTGVKDTDKEQKLNKYRKEYNGLDNLRGKFNNNKYVKDTKDILQNKFRVPDKQATALIESIESSMSQLMYGTKEEPGLKDWLHDAVYTTLDKSKIGQSIIKALNRVLPWFRQLFSKNKASEETASTVEIDYSKSGNYGASKAPSGYEEAGKYGKESDNDLSEIYNAEDPFKNQYARGARRITRTGLAVVSEGEMIVPSELNPFYHGVTHKNQQIVKERGIGRRFFGRYAAGTANVNSKTEPVSDSQTQGFLSGTKNFVKGGAVELLSFLGSIYQSLVPQNSKKKQEEDEKKDKAKISDLITNIFKDAGDQKGSMAAGAIIGGASSLLTGGIIGPIAGAAIGSAVALTAKSTHIQEALFGPKEKDENGKETGNRTGGLFNKKLSNFMTKYLPDMGKGAGIGGIAGAFFGSPLIGAVVGSSIEYVKKSDRMKDMLFGPETKDEQGNTVRDDATAPIKQAFIKKLKERSGGVAAGAIAGALVGPPLPGGILTNIVLGSALGFVAKSEQAQKFLFGDKDTDEKGIITKIGTFFKTKLFDPMIGIVDKLTESLKNHMRDGMANIGKSVREYLLKKAGKKIIDRAKNSAIGRGIMKVGKGLLTPVRALTNIPGAINTRLEKSALRKGYNIMDRSKGRYMTASERLAQSDKYGINTKNTEIDRIISQVQSPEELEEMMTSVEGMIDPNAQVDKQLTEAKNGTSEELQKYVNLSRDNRIESKANTKTANDIRSLLNAKKFSDAITMVKNSNIPDKEAVIKAIQNQQSLSNKKDETKSNTDAAKRKLLANSKFKGKNLNDNDLRAIRDKLTAEKSGRTEFNITEPKTPEEKATAATIKLPSFLETIISLLAAAHPKAAKNLAAKNPTVKGVIDKINNDAEKAQKAKEDKEKAEAGRSKDIDNDGLTESVDQYGNEQVDQSSTKNRKTLKDRLSNMKNIGLIGTISAGISSIGAKLGDFGSKLFGKKGEKKKGLFASIIDGLTGDNNIFGKVINWVTGGKGGIKGLLSNLSGTTFISFLKDKLLPEIVPVLGVTAALAVLSGKFDNIASALKLGGTPSSSKGGTSDQTTVTYTDAKGVTHTLVKQSDGTWKDMTTGEVVKSDDPRIKTENISVLKGSTNTLSENAKGAVVRGIATAKPSFLTAALGKTRLGKTAGTGLKTIAGDMYKAATTEGLESSAYVLSVQDDVLSAVTKIFSKLKGVPFFKGHSENLDAMAAKLSTNISNVLTGSGAMKVTKFIGKAVVWLQIFYVVRDFTTGYEDASSTLGIKDPSVGYRVIAGILRTLKNCIPILGVLIPDNLLINIFVDYIAPIVGISTTEFKKQREEANAEVENYNKTHGTSYKDWKDYDKSVRHDYTWEERVGNSAKTTWAQTKAKGSNFVSSVKKNGLGTTITNGVKSIGNTFDETSKVNGGGVTGAIEGIGAAFQKMLPGVLGEIPQAKAHIYALALKGDIGGLWKVSLKEFSKSTPEEAAVGPFSTFVGQIPLVATKLQGTVIGAIPAALNALGIGKAVGGAVKGAESAAGGMMNSLESGPLGGVVKGIESVAKVAVDLKLLSTKGDLAGIWKYKNPDTSTGFSRFVTDTSLIAAKVSETPVAIASFIGQQAVKYTGGRLKEIGGTVAGVCDTAIQLAKGTFDNPIALWKTQVKVKEDSPIAGYANTLVAGEKLLLTPLSVTSWVLKNAAKGLVITLGAVGKGVVGFAEEQIDMTKAALSSPKDLWNLKLKTPADNIPVLGPVLSAILGTQKILYMPISLGAMAAKFVYKGIKGMFENTVSDFETLNTSLGNMQKASDGGHPLDVLKEIPKLKDPLSPMGMIEMTILHVAKAFYSIMGLVNKLTGNVSDSSEKTEKATTETANNADGLTLLKNKVANSAVGKAATNVYNGVTGGVGGLLKSGATAVNGLLKGVSGVQMVDANGNPVSTAGSGSGFVSQYNSKYANMPIGNSNVANNGCAPASAVMAMRAAGRNTSFTNAIANANAYQTGSGTDASYFGDMAASNGMNASYYTNGSDIVNSISSGRPTVLLGQDSTNRSKANSPFGPNNHYVVANGVDSNGRVVINDPESNRGNRRYSPSILKHVKMGIGMSGGAAAIGTDASSTVKKATNAISGNFAMDQATRYISASKNAASSNQFVYVEPSVDNYVNENLGVWSDVSEEDLNAAIAKISPSSPFNGQANVFIKAAKESGLDPRYILAHAALESGWGTSKIAKNKNNYFGIAAFDSSPYASAYSFGSGLEAGIVGGALWIAEHYYHSKYGQTSLYKMKHDTRHPYATDATWDQKIARGMMKLPPNTKLTLVEGAQSSMSGTVGGNDIASSTATSNDNGTSGVSNTTGSTGETDYKSMGILGAISSVFSKIGNLFTGGTDSSTSGNSTGTTSGDTSGTSSSNVSGMQWSGKTPVDIMKSIEGKIQYSQSGPRNPDKGSADCSSTVQWAIKKAGGPDIGGNTGAQYNNSNLTQVWHNASGTSTLPAGIQANDVMFFNRGTSRTDGVGHVGLYMGNGKLIDHGEGIGPKEKDLNSSRLSKLIKVSRVAGMNSSTGTASSGGGTHPYTDPSGASTTFTDAEWKALQDTWAYTGIADQEIAKHSCSDLHKVAAAKLGTSGSGSGLLHHMSSRDALMYRASKHNPYYSGGDSALDAIGNTFTTSLNSMTSAATSAGKTVSNIPGAISSAKDTASLLKVIITLISKIVDNTQSVSQIYTVVAAILKSTGNSAAASQLASYAKANSSSSNDEIEKSLSDLRSTVNSWFADSNKDVM